MSYLVLKHVHVTAVAVSYCLFFVRGAWMIADSPRLAQRWVKIVPHVNDTVLLAAALWMMAIIDQYPGTAGWLTAKVAGLIAYILLGTVAIKRGSTKRIRAGAWVAAQLVFFYIVAVALTRDAFPIRGWLS